MLSLGLIYIFYISLIYSHMIWEYPPSRSTSNNIRTPPCGGIPRGNGEITTFNAGDEVDLKWSIDIDHSNYPLRITLSQNNNDVYDCVILNNIPHPDSTGEPVRMQWKWYIHIIWNIYGILIIY